MVRNTVFPSFNGEFSPVARPEQSKAAVSRGLPRVPAADTCATRVCVCTRLCCASFVLERKDPVSKYSRALSFKFKVYQQSFRHHIDVLQF